MYNTYIHISCHTHTHTQFTWPTAATGPACDVLVRPAQRCSAATTITCRSMWHMRRHMGRHAVEERKGTNMGGEASLHVRACMRTARHIISPPAPADAPSVVFPPLSTLRRARRCAPCARARRHISSQQLSCLLEEDPVAAPVVHYVHPLPNGRNERTC